MYPRKLHFSASNGPRSPATKIATRVLTKMHAKGFGRGSLGLFHLFCFSAAKFCFSATKSGVSASPRVGERIRGRTSIRRSLREENLPPRGSPRDLSGKKKQHKHKLFGPDCPRTFLTLTPGCPGVKKFLHTTGAAGKRTFWCGRPRFPARMSMTRRVVEKLCTEKVCVDFFAPNLRKSPKPLRGPVL